MTSFSRSNSFTSRIAILLIGLAAQRVYAELPVSGSRVTPEAYQLLDALAAGQPSGESAVAILVAGEAGEPAARHQLAVILVEASEQRAIASNVLTEFLASRDCASRDAGGRASICTEVESLQAARTSNRLMTETDARVAAQTELARNRAAMIRAEQSTGATDAIKEAYVRSLIAQNANPLEEALRLYCDGAANLDAEDEAAVRAMGAGDVSIGVDRFRQAIGSVFRVAILSARGRETVVRQIRVAPADLLTRALRVNDGYVSSTLDGSGSPVRCTLDAWRSGSEAPSQWVAWKRQLQCSGW